MIKIIFVYVLVFNQSMLTADDIYVCMYVCLLLLFLRRYNIILYYYVPILVNKKIKNTIARLGRVLGRYILSTNRSKTIISETVYFLIVILIFFT